MFNFGKMYSFIILLLMSFNSSAATSIDVKQHSTSFLQSLLNTQLSLPSTQLRLEKKSSSLDLNHTLHTRYQETYAGYPIFGADIIVHTPQKGGPTYLAESMNGIIYQNLEKDLAQAPLYIFSSAQAQKALKRLQPKDSQNATSNLMIYVDESNIAHWSYLIDFRTHSINRTPQKLTFIIDATNFKVYKNWNAIPTLETVQAGGNGGNFKTGIYNYDGLPNHLPSLTMQRDPISQTCYLKNADVTVLNASLNNAIMQFKCNNTNIFHNSIYWNGMFDSYNFGFSPSNDALYAGKIIKNMYKQWYQIPVLIDKDGNDLMLTMRVHDHSLQAFENAYWDPDNQTMTFGDGFLTLYPLVSLSVGAHEISHGFTSQHSNLVYSEQSGGINESFSDMAAMAAEYFANGKSSWQIGADIFKATNKALRYLDEPTKDCEGRNPGNYCSISNAIDYSSKIDVHFTSGIFNKAFYLLSTSQNWNPKKAFDVMVQANMHYWTSNTFFPEAACGVIHAAKDYKYDIESVKKAFLAVGVYTTEC